MAWRPKTSPQAATMSSTELTTPTTPQEVFNTEDRYDLLTLERMSAQALTVDAHGSHCSMTHSHCTSSLPIAFKHNEVVRVNPNFTQVLVFPAKHMKSNTVL